MPLEYPDFQASYSPQSDSDGLPIGKVITLGNGRWLTVCPEAIATRRMLPSAG